MSALLVFGDHPDSTRRCAVRILAQSQPARCHVIDGHHPEAPHQALQAGSRRFSSTLPASQLRLQRPSLLGRPEFGKPAAVEGTRSVEASFVSPTATRWKLPPVSWRPRDVKVCCTEFLCLHDDLYLALKSVHRCAIHPQRWRLSQSQKKKTTHAKSQSPKARCPGSACNR